MRKTVRFEKEYAVANQETILIADNSEIYRAILRGLFEGEYNLLEAENGEQALMMMRQYRESIMKFCKKCGRRTLFSTSQS